MASEREWLARQRVPLARLLAEALFQRNCRFIVPSRPYRLRAVYIPTAIGDSVFVWATHTILLHSYVFGLADT